MALHRQRDTAVLIDVFLPGIHPLLITNRGRSAVPVQITVKVNCKLHSHYVYLPRHADCSYLQSSGALVASHAVPTKGSVVYHSEMCNRRGLNGWKS